MNIKVIPVFLKKQIVLYYWLKYIVCSIFKALNKLCQVNFDLTVMACLFCEKQVPTPSLILENKSCLNCYTQFKRNYKKCYHPTCFRQSNSIFEDRFYCDKCNQRRIRKKLESEKDLLMKLATTDLNPTEKYEMMRKIGHGSSGTVYKAIERTTKNEVAIKKMSLKEIKIRYINNEIILMKSNVHPNIIRFLECCYADEEAWIVME